MKNKKKTACNRFRVLGNGGMVAGFLLLCLAVEAQAVVKQAAQETALAAGSAGGGALESAARFLPAAGLFLLAAGFLCKLLLWRCPRCGCRLLLCARGDGKACPCCREPL